MYDTILFPANPAVLLCTICLKAFFGNNSLSMMLKYKCTYRNFKEFCSLSISYAMIRKLNYCSHSSITSNIQKIRNIGIMAHIDAGKTTTTERMLYYSGKINHMGEVHRGNTVTDYLELERDRGITITSASVTIPWLDHQINVIDTPGHIDFTFEVEQSLSVIDGAVIVLDGSAGVEAQTVTVWRQADEYNIPRLVYINKMDRIDASLELCLKSLASKFGHVFLPLQLALKGENGGIKSIIDIVNCDLLTWSGDQGENISRIPIKEKDNLFERTQKARNAIIEQLADMDDDFTELVINETTLENVKSEQIYNVLQKVTHSRKAFPVFVGSSYKNIGVQKMMDAVINILPSPETRSDLKIYSSFDRNLCAKAFKVVHDKLRGPVTFFRIYSGSMKKGQKIYNVNREKNEQIQKLMIALADDYEEIQEIEEGNIVAVSGLKYVRSGDIISTSPNVIKSAINTLALKMTIPERKSESLLFPKLISPEPVFFCSIEAPSLMYQTALDNALEQLQREDPSLQIKLDPDTDQTIMGGMGELHLEIIKHRIRTEYNIDVNTGPLQIAYREKIISSAKECTFIELNIGSSHYKALISLSISPKTENTEHFITLDKSIDNISNTAMITPKQMNMIKEGIQSALFRGPKIGCQVNNACFILYRLETKKHTPTSVISSAAAQCTKKLLNQITSILIEPYMKLEIIVDEEHSSFVMSDLLNRRADILDFDYRKQYRIIRAIAPLSELLGYSNKLRIGTSGTAHFTMEFNGYREVSEDNEREAIKNITGFYPA